MGKFNKDFTPEKELTELIKLLIKRERETLTATKTVILEKDEHKSSKISK